MKKLELWHYLIPGGALLALGSLLWAKRASASTLPVGPKEDGSLPDVPGLRDREAKEPGFVNALLRVVRETGADGDKLAAIMSEESRFDPQALNPISGTVGFLQWMPGLVPGLLGTTASDLHSMTGIEQLEYVKRTIQKVPAYKNDPPMAGWGHGANSPDDTVLATEGQIAYTQNKGYDKSGKGSITSGDVRAAVYSVLGPAKNKPRVTS